MRPTPEAPLRAKVPANVERKDRVLFGLSGHQLAIVTVTGLLIYTAWTALAALVHPLVFAVAALPVAGVGFILAVGRRDGLSLDTWIWAAVRHRRSPHRLVPATEPIIPAPSWVATTTGPGDRLPLPAPLRLPATAITGDGLIDLGGEGTTALVSASTVAFGLRTPGEQNALVAGFARWLQSLDAPTQILVRAQPVDLTALAWRIGEQAPSLPHPALEAAARSHAEFLVALAAERELLRRQVTVAVRSPRGAGHSMHRAAEAVRALSACEVTARVLDPAGTTAVLAGCLNPAAGTTSPGWGPSPFPDPHDHPEV
ncbi:MAG: PrgI family protein [Dactylosporangium sp.]|nr:PrgI family protein [Dactylosporangium sp.]NNJ62411.1 PrgI family protein [Dactylosporangium sp.]